MNEKRRNQIRDAISHLEKAKDIVSDVSFEEQDAMDSMPENLQGSDRYSAMADALDALEDAESSIEEAQESLDRALE